MKNKGEIISQLVRLGGELRQERLEGPISEAKRAEILAKYGIGYYIWEPRNSRRQTTESMLEEGGLRLKRVYP